jgi:hypothetical protein
VLTAFVLVLIFSLGTVLGQTIWLSGLLLPNLLPQAAFRPLDWVTRTPQMMHVAIPYRNGYLHADLYVPAKPRHSPTVLLAIHGVNEKGKDDQRLVNAGPSYPPCCFLSCSLSHSRAASAFRGRLQFPVESCSSDTQFTSLCWGNSGSRYSRVCVGLLPREPIADCDWNTMSIHITVRHDADSTSALAESRHGLRG